MHSVLHSANIHQLKVKIATKSDEFKPAPVVVASNCALLPFTVFKLRLSSGITWVLVYRTEKYKKLKAEVEKQSKKRKYLIQQGFMLGQL